MKSDNNPHAVRKPISAPVNLFVLEKPVVIWPRSGRQALERTFALMKMGRRAIKGLSVFYAARHFFFFFVCFSLPLYHLTFDSDALFTVYLILILFLEMLFLCERENDFEHCIYYVYYLLFIYALPLLRKWKMTRE